MSEAVSSRSKSQKAVAQIVIAAMMLALAVVLEFVSSMIPFLHFPNGGSVSFVMVPLVLCSLLCGWYWGLGVGVAFGLINALMDGGFAYHWASIVLDYVIGFGVAGVAGVFSRPFFQKKAWAPIAGVTVAGLLRFLSSFLSGIIVWNSLYDYDANVITPDWSGASVSYSLTYNGGYMLPSIVLSILVVALIIKPLFVVLDTPIVRSLKPENLQESSFVLPTFDKLAPVYLGICAAFAVIAMIPAIKMYWIGIVGIVTSLSIIGYLVYCLVKDRKEGKDCRMHLLYLILALVCLALNIVGVISIATYGASFYVEAE